MRVWLLGVILFTGGILAEVEYESEVDAVDTEQDKRVDRTKDGKSGPAYMNYAPQCNIHPNYVSYCAYRVPGLYTYTADYNCYIQCDEWHWTFILPCAYGTYWKPDGYEPTTYNRCVGIKSGEYQYAPPPANVYRSAAPKPDPFTVTRKIVKHETTSYGAQGQVNQNGQVHQHVHVHHNPPTAAPYTASNKPLQYSNLVDMYISGKPAHYARKSADTKSVEMPTKPQVHQLTNYQPRAPAPPRPPVAPVAPQQQALPQIQLAPPQAPPRPQTLPVIQHYQPPQAPQALPQKQPVPQQVYAQPQPQPVQLVAQSIPVQQNPHTPQGLQQPKPNLSNRITLNSRFPVAGHQNTKTPHTVNTQNLVSNNSPGLNPRGARLGLGRANQVRRLAGGAQQGNRIPRRPGLNQKLMNERRRRLAQWQQYLRQSKQQNHLNGAGGGDGQLTTAMTAMTARRRRRLFNRRRLQKAAGDDQAEDIVNDDAPTEDVVDAATESDVTDDSASQPEEQVNQDDQYSDEEYAAVENYIADDQANSVYYDDLYENVASVSSEADSDSDNVSLYSSEKLNDEANSVEIQLTSSNENLKGTETSQIFVINNAPKDIPANIPK